MNADTADRSAAGRHDLVGSSRLVGVGGQRLIDRVGSGVVEVGVHVVVAPEVAAVDLRREHAGGTTSVRSRPGGARGRGRRASWRRPAPALAPHRAPPPCAERPHGSSRGTPRASRARRRRPGSAAARSSRGGRRERLAAEAVDGREVLDGGSAQLRRLVDGVAEEDHRRPARASDGQPQQGAAAGSARSRNVVITPPRPRARAASSTFQQNGYTDAPPAIGALVEVLVHHRQAAQVDRRRPARPGSRRSRRGGRCGVRPPGAGRHLVGRRRRRR